MGLPMNATLHSLISRVRDFLPGPMRRLLTDARVTLVVQLMMFASVGLVGLAVDTSVVYAVRGWVGLYIGGLISYLCAATVTWLLNRIWTFKGQGSGPVHRQWAFFLLANLAGFVLNRGTYFALISTASYCAEYPFVAIAAGAVAGMFVNFGLSRAIVFRDDPVVSKA